MYKNFLYAILAICVCTFFVFATTHKSDPLKLTSIKKSSLELVSPRISLPSITQPSVEAVEEKDQNVSIPKDADAR